MTIGIDFSLYQKEAKLNCKPERLVGHCILQAGSGCKLAEQKASVRLLL